MKSVIKDHEIFKRTVNGINIRSERIVEELELEFNCSCKIYLLYMCQYSDPVYKISDKSVLVYSNQEIHLQDTSSYCCENHKRICSTIFNCESRNYKSIITYLKHKEKANLLEIGFNLDYSNTVEKSKTLEEYFREYFEKYLWIK